MFVCGEILVWKGRAVNTEFAGSIVIDKVSTLQDESFDDSVKGAVQVSHWLLVPDEFSGTKLSKVFARLGALK